MRAANNNGMGLSAWVIALAVSCLAAGPAFAHHPLNGMPMETFMHGLLSGVGHPVLGFDHLFFIIAAGVLATFSGYARSAPLVLMTGVLAGVVLSISGVSLAAAEVLIALSLIILGVIGIRGKSLSLLQMGLLFISLGVFHGWAFGAALVQQESSSATVLGGYLIGLSAVQYVIAVGAGRLMISQFGALKATDLQPRIACAIVTGVGVTFLLENLETLLLA